ncbi:DNA polymerase III subunit delta [Candidatus Saccharibacteria bacterium]|nr:DNA polymerase III subunit delta [Candidatus Saccharibacteria bacterium]
MITLLTGENSFEIQRALGRITSDFSGVAEVLDGENVKPEGLFDLLMSVSLFADKRLVIIKNLSANKAAWQKLNDLLGKLSDDIHLVLVDEKPDKRTITYKTVIKLGMVSNFGLWGSRDLDQAERWLVSEASSQGLLLDKTSAKLLIERVGLDQWQLMHAVEKLSLVGDGSVETINNLIDASPDENVFNLFEMALNGQMDDCRQMLGGLRLSEDAYKLFALLSSQAFQMAVIASASLGDDVSRDFGIHPYAVSKMRHLTQKQSSAKIKDIIRIFSKADQDMKSSSSDPWILIEQMISKIAI